MNITPPHFHARYQDYEASFDFDGNLIKGDFPKRQTRIVQGWVAIHSEELVADWQIASEKEELVEIEPLK